MIGSLNKSYDYTSIIDGERLQHLSEFIKEYFDEVKYEIRTVDGASYKIDTLEEVLSYSNPQSRKIVKLSITANKQKNTHLFTPNLTLSFFDLTLYDKSCILSLNDLEDQEISFLTQRIDEFINGSRPSYWWIHKPLIYWILGAALFTFAIVWFSKSGKESLANGISTLFWIGVSCICFFISNVIIKRCVEYLFPEGGFTIGEQAAYLKKKEKTRNVVLVSVVGSLILGIVSGILVHLIVT